MKTQFGYWTKNVSISTSGKSCVRVGPLKKRDCERSVKLDENFSRPLVFEGTLIYDNKTTTSLFSVTAE